MWRAPGTFVTSQVKLSHRLHPELAYVARDLDPASFALLSTSASVRRAVVFVHGFLGHPEKTWRDFPGFVQSDPAWADTDVFFVGYDSVGDELALSSDYLASFLHLIYPTPPRLLLEGPYAEAGARLRPDEAPYEELVLVGHSAGGVVIRLALLDALQRCRATSGQDGSLSGARLRLFAPALAGERLAGGRGRIARIAGFRAALLIYKGGSPSFQELSQDSQLLHQLRQDTTHVAETCPDLAAFRARVLWAHTDDVVISRRYRHDTSWRARNTDHTSVCKPTAQYPLPVHFSCTGDVLHGYVI